GQLTLAVWCPIGREEQLSFEQCHEVHIGRAENIVGTGLVTARGLMVGTCGNRHRAVQSWNDEQDGRSIASASGAQSGDGQAGARRAAGGGCGRIKVTSWEFETGAWALRKSAEWRKLMKVAAGPMMGWRASWGGTPAPSGEAQRYAEALRDPVVTENEWSRDQPMQAWKGREDVGASRPESAVQKLNSLLRIVTFEAHRLIQVHGYWASECYELHWDTGGQQRLVLPSAMAAAAATASEAFEAEGGWAEELVQELQLDMGRYRDEALAPNTRRCYGTKVKAFVSFCTVFACLGCLTPLLKASDTALCQFG
ncbi:hypothetical protein CYMTET_26778, partial [Cymbomonas tetramitiformis]